MTDSLLEHNCYEIGTLLWGNILRMITISLVALAIYSVAIQSAFSQAPKEQRVPKTPTTKTPDGAETNYDAKKDTTTIKNFNYQRYFVTDKFGRKVTFYLSKTKNEASTKLPLVVSIQGSGSQSIFLQIDTENGTRIVSGGPDSVIRRTFKNKVRVLVVEKPGVEFLVQPSRPGSSEEGTAEFNQEFSLERWVEALNASMCAALKMPRIDPTRVLAHGHSEGAQGK